MRKSYQPTRRMIHSIQRLRSKFYFLDDVHYELVDGNFLAVVSSSLFPDFFYHVLPNGTILDRYFCRFHFRSHNFCLT